MSKIARFIECESYVAASGDRYNYAMRNWLLASTLVLCCAALLTAGEDPVLRDALKDQKYANGWIYEDINAGYAEATKSGKPLLVCFCCVP
jgi:hypothetical protein